ncbi:MAG: O-antigen ligase family protein [bacterium]
MFENNFAHTNVLAPVSTKKFLYLLLAIALPSAILSFVSPIAAIGFFLLGIFILLAIEKPVLLIYGLTFYMPFEAFTLKFTNDSLFPFLKYGIEIGIFILFVVTVGKYLYKPHPNPLLLKERGLSGQSTFIKTPIDKPLIAFIIITAISALLNLTNPLYWILGLRQIFRFTLLYYTIIYLQISLKQIKNIIIILLILLAIQSTIGMGQAMIGKSADKFLIPDKVREIGEMTTSDFVEQSWASGQRVFATMGRYDRLGTFLCFAILISLGLFITTKKNIYLLLILISVPSLILTYSRMSWLGVVIGLCLIGIIHKKDKIIIGWTALVISLFLIYIIFYLANNNIVIHRMTEKSSMEATERFLLLFSSTEFDGSYKGYGRLYFIINTPLKIVKNYPFFGVGLGRYGSGVAASLGNRGVYNEFRIPYGVQNYLGSIDNNWFSLWGESGTLGLIAFMSIIISLFIFTYRFYKVVTNTFSKGITLGFLGAIIAVSFQGFLGQHFEVRPLSFYFWLIAGMIVNLRTFAN